MPAELLGDYLPLLADAAVSGRRPQRGELDAVGGLGRLAAEQGVSAGKAAQLYLSAARRLWRQLPLLVRSRDSEVVRGAADAVLRDWLPGVGNQYGVFFSGHRCCRPALRG